MRKVKQKGLTNMEETKLDVTRTCVITGEDIDDIMSSALDYIGYWCCKVEVVGGKYLGEYASDQISRGGALKLYDAESDDTWLLDKDKFCKGLTAYLAEYADDDVLFPKNGHYHIDCCHIDGPAADMIVQLACMGEVVYG